MAFIGRRRCSRSSLLAALVARNKTFAFAYEIASIGSGDGVDDGDSHAASHLFTPMSFCAYKFRIFTREKKWNDDDGDSQKRIVHNALSVVEVVVVFGHVVVVASLGSDNINKFAT